MIQNLKDTVIQHFLSFLNRIGLLIFWVRITYFYLCVTSSLVLCLLLSVKADANLQLASVVSSCSLFIDTVLCCIIREESKRKDRYFNGKLLTTWSWLQYHRRKKAAFSSICSSNQSEVDHDPKGTFIYKDETPDGFSSSNKGPERFNMHQLSDNHRQCKTKNLLKEKEKIPQLLNDEECRKNRLRQQGLEAHFGTMKTLLRQGLAIRRQDDKEGNVYQFNKDNLKLLMEENKFVSHSLLGEQQEMLVLEARRALNMELQSVKFYVIIVDEATDISKSEHMSLSVVTVLSSTMLKRTLLEFVNAGRVQPQMLCLNTSKIS